MLRPSRASNQRTHAWERMLCQASSRRKNNTNILQIVTDASTDALWPRSAGYVVGNVVGIAHPLPALITSSRTLPHLPRRVADELAREASLLLHIPRGGATYFDPGRPCCVHRARCPEKRACVAIARCCDPSGRLALDRTLLPKAVGLVLAHIALFLTLAFDFTPHYPSPCGCALCNRPYFAIQGPCACF